MRDMALLGARLVLGGYLAAHGAEKLFGSFGGYGPDGTGAFFDSQGLSPGRQMAQIAGITEMTSGILTATGALHPLGPVGAAGAMAVAVPFHRSGGALASKGGYELALTNLAAASALAAAGTGRLRLGPKLPGKLAVASVLGAAAIAGYLVNKVIRFTPPVPEVDLTEGDSAEESAVAELGTS